MATVNLGRIKPIFKGAYAGGTAYVVDDIVTSGNETFICIQASTGNATSNASYWTKLAAKGADGTDLTSTLTTQGDILYRDGSGLQRLPKGTAGQIIQMNSGATAPEYADASGGIISTGGFSAGQNIWTYKWSNQTATSTQWTSSVDITGSTWNLGSALTSNKKCIITYSVCRREDDWNHTFIRLLYATNSSGNNWSYIDSTENVDGHGWENASSANLTTRSTATFEIDFTTGQYPSFKMNGGRFGSSNNLKINYDQGNDGTVHSYYQAWFV